MAIMCVPLFFQTLFGGLDLVIGNRQCLGRKLVIGGVNGLFAFGRIPLSVRGSGGMRIIPRRRPLGQFGTVGGGIQDLAEPIELPSLRRGQGAAGLGCSKLVHTLLGDGALSMGKLVGLVGAEGASCGSFAGQILNGPARIGDRRQGAFKGKNDAILN